MKGTFSEVKLFQVKPEKLEDFETLVRKIQKEQKQCKGCLDIKYMKRFYTFDGVGIGNLPKELTRIVKCVKYFSYWQFKGIEEYAAATAWFFENYEKPLAKLLIMPFDIHCGQTVE